MGVVPKAEKTRDRRLIADYLKKNRKGEWKYSIKELGYKYAREDGVNVIPLTRTRIHQILNKNMIVEKRVKRAVQK